jgi:hypothetical protein
MPGISKKLSQQNDATNAALKASGNTGRGAVRFYGDDTAKTIAAKKAVLAGSANSGAPKAIDAPSKGQNNIFNGLCEALNQHQKSLEKKYPGYVADVYNIEFASEAIGSAKVTKPGPVTYKNTAGKNLKTAADKVVSATDSMNVNSQTWNILAGTQIVQLIDQIMRSSTFITSQQLGNYDENGVWKANPSAGTGKVNSWYKISVNARQLKYDNYRRDHAYNITYVISPFATYMISPYFPPSQFRGPHKTYAYWFTGLNTQILNYEQEYNQAYYTTITGTATGLANSPPNGRDQIKRTYMATSEQRGQGQANYVNEPADSAAAFLYSVADFSEVRLKILGDPAWMQQGEVAFGAPSTNFSFSPFNADGGINYDSQQVTFTVSFNRPTDYDFNTGIMNMSSTGAPQETFTFIAKSCKNVFSKGQFTQELVGSLQPMTNSNSNVNNGRATNPTVTNTAAGVRLSPSGYQNEEQQYADGNGTGATDETSPSGYQNEEQQYADGNGGIPDPQPAPPPEAPTSSGDIDQSFQVATPQGTLQFPDQATYQAWQTSSGQGVAFATGPGGVQYASQIQTEVDPSFQVVTPQGTLRFPDQDTYQEWQQSNGQGVAFATGPGGVQYVLKAQPENVPQVIAREE